jgi:glycosyltransferase involved in cell wall biosynthesis
MRRLLFVGSHLGYPMDRTPLGGGAMVGLQLARHWSPEGVTLIGSGPVAPRPDMEYVRLPEKAPEAIVSLSELGYARFCRDFEKDSTEWIMARRDRFPPAETTVLVNDISEGPDLAVLADAGYKLVSIWHVDVVDYFNKLYLKSVLPPESVTGFYERIRGFVPVPDVLKLVFEKQRQTVRLSAAMILPSSAMAETIRRCYGEEAASRCVVVPWGMWRETVSEERAQAELPGLRDHYQIGPKTRVVLTLSRISPEKGLHLLMRALRRAEERFEDLCVLVCGEPAFMQGERYAARVRGEAAKLRKARVFFPGYLDPQSKHAYFKLAELFVSPSLHESYGLNVVEALQAGLPVLACDHDGARDVLKNDYGLCVTPAGLGPALSELLADPERLRAMGRAAAGTAGDRRFQKAADRVREVAA